jgi:hypothetical protein
MGMMSSNGMDAGLVEHPIEPWREQLNEACDDRDIITIANRYLGRWPLKQFFHLPEDCRPNHIASAEELSHWAFHLRDSLDAFAGTEEEHVLLEHLTVFFELAYHRLSELSRALFETPRTGVRRIPLRLH